MSEETAGTTTGSNDRDDGEVEQESIPRTDRCTNCETDITAELVKLDGQHELIHEARTAEEGFHPVTAGSVDVTLSCRCSYVTVTFGPGSASAWDIPDEWTEEVSADV